MGKLSDKVAIVTGASQGIGKAICRAFGQDGAALVINARNADKLSQAKSELEKLGVPVLMVAGDISQPETGAAYSMVWFQSLGDLTFSSIMPVHLTVGRSMSCHWSPGIG